MNGYNVQHVCAQRWAYVLLRMLNLPNTRTVDEDQLATSISSSCSSAERNDVALEPALRFWVGCGRIWDAPQNLHLSNGTRKGQPSSKCMEFETATLKKC